MYVLEVFDAFPRSVERCWHNMLSSRNTIFMIGVSMVHSKVLNIGWYWYILHICNDFDVSDTQYTVTFSVQYYQFSARYYWLICWYQYGFLYIKPSDALPLLLYVRYTKTLKKTNDIKFKPNCHTDKKYTLPNLRDCLHASPIGNK